MKIHQVRTSINQSKEIIHKLGYGDSASAIVRESMREHILSKAMPYYDEFHSKGRISEYELNKLIASLTKKPNVNIEKLKDLKIWNFAQHAENALRGQSLCEEPQYLKYLKDAGFERVIDLSEYGGSKYKKDCENSGLEYLSFTIDRDFWFGNEVFEDINHHLNNKKSLYEEEEYNPSIEKEIKEYFHENSRIFIDRFVNFINTINKGYYYMGCLYGTDKTDAALMLSQFFNPRDKQFIRKVHASLDEYQLPKMAELAKKLTQEDKNALGWTPEFEENFYKKIKSEKKRLELE